MNDSALRVIAATTMTVCLLSCGGGGGGGDTITLTQSDQDADPVVLEIPVAYIRRTLPETPRDLRDPLGFEPGAQLLLRPRAAASAEDLDLTPRLAAIAAEELGVEAETLALDIKDLESSYDGNVLIFTARIVPEPVDANLELTTWNLWTYTLDSDELAYLIPSRIKRNEGVESGGGQDIGPHFLPDDRVVFSSTRQVANQARQLNEGRVQIFSALDEDNNDPAAVLHVYDPLGRGNEFEQISFNLSHDLDPVVLSSGDIIFSRWNNTGTDHISLYRIDPSGAGLAPLYGFHSRNTGTDGSAIAFSQPRELDDGRIASLARATTSTTLGGTILLIDTANHAEFATPLWDAPEGPGHEPLTATDMRTDGLLSRGGQFASVYPLRDGSQRLLVTWSDCRVLDENDEARIQPCSLQPDNENTAPPLYGAWVYDPIAVTQRPVVIGETDFQVSEIAALEPRDFPSLRPRADDFDGALALEGKGRIEIHSVYSTDGDDSSPAGIGNHARPGSAAFSARPVRFLRIVEPVLLPDADIFEVPAFAFGVSRAFGFREIGGYLPVEPDGSVTAVVPAGRPFTIETLNAAGRRIGPRHNYWLQLSPGETLRCSGCHSAGSTLPHGRSDSPAPRANTGAVALADGATGFPDTASNILFADTAGESMAAIWNARQPAGNSSQAERPLELAPRYTDQWSSADLEPQAPILDRDYDPAWTDIPPEQPLIVPNLDPSQPARIVINYEDHIQPIWSRLRAPVLDALGVPVDNCLGCHNDLDATAVPAGQLDLSAVASDIEARQLRSYRELLSADAEQWLDTGDALADRTRVCTTVDADGNVLTSTETLAIAASMNAGSALASNRFFDCFEGGVCGRPDSPPLPDNCTEDGGTAVPATRNTVAHEGMLSASELRLLSEWLDLGGQYFNNPFDPRLAD